MGLLKLVIVDDEPILLEGLVKTYDWNGMGYEVVGFAQSGEQALKVIREKKPHVVLTDIRMKQISGLMVMEEIKKENPECQFVVLSAYRDFEYAKKACDLGAFAYLLKPIEDEKLQATMTDVGKICEDQIRNEEKYDRWERLLKKDGDGFTIRQSFGARSSMNTGFPVTSAIASFFLIGCPTAFMIFLLSFCIR